MTTGTAGMPVTDQSCVLPLSLGPCSPTRFVTGQQAGGGDAAHGVVAAAQHRLQRHWEHRGGNPGAADDFRTLPLLMAPFKHPEQQLVVYCSGAELWSAPAVCAMCLRHSVLLAELPLPQVPST